MVGFLKTDMVDWESKRIQFGSMPLLLDCASMYACCVRVVPDVVDRSVGVCVSVVPVVLDPPPGAGHASE